MMMTLEEKPMSDLGTKMEQAWLAPDSVSLLEGSVEVTVYTISKQNLKVSGVCVELARWRIDACSGGTDGSLPLWHK